MSPKSSQMIERNLLITISIKAKLGPTQFRSYIRSKVKVIKERTPTIWPKICTLVNCDLLITMSIKAKLGPTYLLS